MIGSNLEEERLFMIPNTAIDYISEDMLKGLVGAYGLPLEETLSTYRETRSEASPGDLMEAILTDWFFRIPALRVAEARSKEAAGSTYVYEFAWRSPAFEGRLGACHALEIGFAFDTLDKEDNLPLTGPNPPQALPIACTPPGSLSSKTATLAGHNTISKSERLCALMRPPKL